MLRSMAMLHLLKLRFTQYAERCLLRCKPAKGVGYLYVRGSCVRRKIQV